MNGTVLSVNVGRPATYRWLDRDVVTAIRKAPVAGRVRASGVNLNGDDQGDRRNHGGPDQAVYAYAVEDADAWASELGRELPAGTFGENLTLQGVELGALPIGARLRIGSCVLRVTGPRIPCLKLGMVLGDRRFPARFAKAARPGAYLGIEVEGELGAGDVVEVFGAPGHGVTVGLLHRAYHQDRSLWAHVPDLEDLPPEWLAIAQEQRARLRSDVDGPELPGDAEGSGRRSAIAHRELAFAAPLDEVAVDALVARLPLRPGAAVLDVGCGWGEVLQRVVARHPVHGRGVDTSPDALARGAAAASARGLGSDRLVLELADAGTVRFDPVDLAICIGYRHALGGGTADALAALRGLLRPGGAVLLGEGFWQAPPDPAGLADFEMDPGELLDLDGLLELIDDHGLRMTEVVVSSRTAWDAYEDGWASGLERHVAEHPDDRDAQGMAEAAAAMRASYRDWRRAAMGFALIVCSSR